MVTTIVLVPASHSRQDTHAIQQRTNSVPGTGRVRIYGLVLVVQRKAALKIGNVKNKGERHEKENDEENGKENKVQENDKEIQLRMQVR